MSIVAIVLLLSLPGMPTDRYVAAAADRLFRGLQLQTLAVDSSIQWRVIETNYSIKLWNTPFWVWAWEISIGRPMNMTWVTLRIG